MDVLAVVILFQVCLLQSFEAMPAKSHDDWATNTRSESPPDIPLPNNGLLPSNVQLPSKGNRSWFFYQSNGGTATMGNVGKTGTGNDVQWRQTGTHINGHFSNQSIPNRPSGIFRTFYFSSNNTSGNNITNNFMNRGRKNGFNSGHNINPNVSMGGNSSFFFTSGVMNYTGSGNDEGNILEILKKNASFGQIHAFQSQKNPTNFTNPGFFQNISKRIQSSLGKNSMYNSTMIKHMSSGPITWHSPGHNQIPDMFNGANGSSNFVIFSNGTRIINSYQNGFNYSKIQEIRVDPSTTISPLTNVQNITFDTKERNFSLNSLFEITRNSRNRQLNQNQVGSAEQHSPSQKDIDRVFNSFQLPVFNRKNLKGSSSDILRDLKEVVKFWMKGREKDISESSTTTIPADKEITAKDNNSETDHEGNKLIIIPQRNKPAPKSNEEFLVTNANQNESKTLAQPLNEAEETTMKTADNVKLDQRARTGFKENQAANDKRIGKAIKPKTQTSVLKTTVKPVSSSTQTSPTRPFGINQRDKSKVKQGESTHVGDANELAKTLEHYNDPISADLPPIFVIPAKTRAEARTKFNPKFTTIATANNKEKLTAPEEFQANAAVTNEEKSIINTTSEEKEMLPKILVTNKEKSTVPWQSNLGELQPNIHVRNKDNSTLSRISNHDEFQPKLPETNKKKSTVPGPSKQGELQPKLPVTNNEKSTVPNNEKSTVPRLSKQGNDQTNTPVTNREKSRVGVSPNISSNTSTEHKNNRGQIPKTRIQQIFIQDGGLSTPSIKPTLPPIFAPTADSLLKHIEPNEVKEPNEYKSKRTYPREPSKSLKLLEEGTTPANAIGKTRATYSRSSFITTTIASTVSRTSNRQLKTSNDRIKWLQYPSVNASTTSELTRSSELGERTIKTIQDNKRGKTLNEQTVQQLEVATKPTGKTIDPNLTIYQMSGTITTTQGSSDSISHSQSTSVLKDKKADDDINELVNVKEPGETLRPMTDSYNTIPTDLPPIFIPYSTPKLGMRPHSNSETAVTNMMSMHHLQSKPEVVQPNGEVKFPKDNHEVPTGNKEKSVQISRKNTPKIIKDKHSINHIEDKTVPEIETKKDNQLKKPLYPLNHSSHETPDVMPPIFLPPIVVPKSTKINGNSHNVATNLSPGKTNLDASVASFGSKTNPTTRRTKNSRLYTLKMPNTEQVQTLKDSADSVFSSTTLPSIFSKAPASSRSAKIEKSEISNTAMNNRFRDPDDVHDDAHIWVIGDTNKEQEAATNDAARKKEMSAKNTFHKTLGDTGTKGLRQKESEETSNNKLATGKQHIPKAENQQHTSTGKYIQEKMKPTAIKSKDNQFGGVTVASKIDAIMNLLYRGLSSTVTTPGRIPEATSRLDNKYSILSGRSTTVTSLAPVVITMDQYDSDDIDRSTVPNDKLYSGRKGIAGNVLKYTTPHNSLYEKRIRTDVPYTTSPMSFPYTTRKVSNGERAAGLSNYMTKSSGTIEPSGFKSENTLLENTDTKSKKNVQNDKLHKITIPILELFLTGRPDLGNIQKKNKPFDNSLVESTTGNAFNGDAQKHHGNEVFGINAFQDTTKEPVVETSKMVLPSDTERRISRNVKTGINILNALFPTSPKTLTPYRVTSEPSSGLNTNGLSKFFTPRLHQ